ncbi:helix-turn-helix domain-containing protein, partial [Mycobacteroides abscessus]|nr:helix-turn-helix domain-containing protein [Mycobacteroides abscessus]
AERFGVSMRTVQRFAAEPREEFLARAAERRARVVELRAAGLKYTDIAEQVGCSIGVVGRLIHDARRHGEFPAKGSASIASNSEVSERV